MPILFPNKWAISKAWMFFLVWKACLFLHFHHKGCMYCSWDNRTNSNFWQMAAEFLMRSCPWLLYLRAWDLGSLFSSWLAILVKKIKNSVTALKCSHQGQGKLSLAVLKHLDVGTKVKCTEDGDGPDRPISQSPRKSELPLALWVLRVKRSRPAIA